MEEPGADRAAARLRRRGFIAPDRTAFVGGDAGVWAKGPSARATVGTIGRCAASTGAGFQRMLDLDPLSRAFLGCAAEPERAIQFREIRDANTLRLWPDDEPPDWYEVVGGLEPRVGNVWMPPAGSWIVQKKTERPWAHLPESSVSGTIQRFGGGVILRLERPEGGGTFLLQERGRNRFRWTWQPP